MKLSPVIASYSGQAYEAIQAFLDAGVLSAVARVAESPVLRTELEATTRDELIEMHVLMEQDSVVRLGTCVFLEDDIRKISAVVSEFSKELSALVIEAASAMRDEPPAITNFLVGIIGIGQTLGHTLRNEGIAVDWKNYGGKYARSKVDFNEICGAYTALGQDLQTKSVLRGTRYTAVFIGPGGKNYLLRGSQASRSDDEREYIRQLNVFLTDAFAMLINGEADNAALRLAAHQKGLLRDDKPDSPVLTNESMETYLPVVHDVKRVTHSYFSAKLGPLRELLRSTTSGKQGVPAENMMMNLWRYMRRAIARRMYTAGFFTDCVRETGLITVFYENNIETLAELLG